MASKQNIQSQSDLREKNLLKRIDGLVKAHEENKSTIRDLNDQLTVARQMISHLRGERS